MKSSGHTSNISLSLKHRQDMVLEGSGTFDKRVEICPGLTKVITAAGEGLDQPGPGDTVKGNDHEWPLILIAVARDE